MATELQSPRKAGSLLYRASALTGLLQRKCACGGTPGPSGECEECRKKKLQRKVRDSEAATQPSTLNSPPSEAPPIVHEVLRSSGQPLDAETRAFMEPHFGHDFGKVRVHTDARASESTHAVNALAYAVGQDVVFASGQYAPHTEAGARLLAHELAHTVQNPEPTGLFPSLRIGPADVQAEQMADRAADAVMRNERISLPAAAGPVLQRQQRTCAADPPAPGQPTKRNVRCSDGSEYRVTLTITPQPARPDTQVTVNAGLNDSELRVTIRVCRGSTAVEISPHSGDLSEPVSRALANIVGGSNIFSGVTGTPGLSITVMQNKSFVFSVDPTLTVGQTGVTGGGVGATVQTPSVTATVGAIYSAPTKAWVFTLTLSGGRPAQQVSCYKDSDPYLVFTCEQVTRTPGHPAERGLSVPEEVVRHVFFDFPSAKIRRDFHLPTDIQDLYNAGYRFKSIDGFTSPEGPRGHEHEPKFEGNIDLSKERAEAAYNWLQDEACKGCDFTGVTRAGESELPPEVGKEIPEQEGLGMERRAVSEFLGETPGITADPLAPKTPAELEAFRRLPASQQRKQAFELMRRATITMQRQRVIRESRPAVPERVEYKTGDCAKDVTEAARKSFGITIF